MSLSITEKLLDADAFTIGEDDNGDFYLQHDSSGARIEYDTAASDWTFSGGIEDIELPSGSKLAEDNGDLVVQDSNGDIVLRYDEGSSEWQFQSEDITGVGSLTTDELNTDTDIHVYGSNGNLLETLDPSGRSTPVDDAQNLSGATGVLLPSGTVEEDSTLTLNSNIRLVGHGIKDSIIKFTDTSNDGVQFDDTDFVWIDGVQFDGKGSRSSGNAWSFINNNSRQVQVGRVRFDNWDNSGAPIIHFDSAHAWSSEWGMLDAQGAGTNAGKTFVVDDSGAPMGINHLYTQTDDWSVDISNVGGSVSINRLNHGGNGPMIRNEAGTNFHFYLGAANWEPNGSPTVTSVIQEKRASRSQYWYVKFNETGGSSLTADQVIELAFNNGDNIIGPIRTKGGTINNNTVNVTSTPVSESWFYGSESNITRSYGDSVGLVRPMQNAGPPGDQPAEIRYGVASDLSSGDKFTPSGTSTNSANWDIIDVHIAEYGTATAEVVEVDNTFTGSTDIQIDLLNLSDGSEDTGSTHDIGYFCVRKV